MTRRHDLDSCLAPTGREIFFTDYWERRPLVVARGEPGYFGQLFGLGDVDALLFATLAEPSRVHVASHAAASFEPVEKDGRIDIGRCRAAVAAGVTLIVDRAEELWLPLARLCRAIAAACHYRASANVYLTPAGAQGFAAHYDTHDVLVLQTVGSKTWRLYGTGAELPIEAENRPVDLAALGAPSREIELAAGDTLYVPRGLVHEAAATGETSLHVTVGIYPVVWLDVLLDALRGAAAQTPAWRQSLPAASLLGDAPASFFDAWSARLGTLAASLDGAAARRRLGARFLGDLAELPDGRFTDLAKVPPEVSLVTRLRHRDGAFFTVQENGEHAFLVGPGVHVAAPAFVADAFRWIAAAEPFRVADIGGDLDDDAKIVLAERLIETGALVAV